MIKITQEMRNIDSEFYKLVAEHFNQRTADDLEFFEKYFFSNSYDLEEKKVISNMLKDTENNHPEKIFDLCGTFEKGYFIAHVLFEIYYGYMFRMSKKDYIDKYILQDEYNKGMGIFGFYNKYGGMSDKEMIEGFARYDFQIVKLIEEENMVIVLDDEVCLP